MQLEAKESQQAPEAGSSKTQILPRGSGGWNRANTLISDF